MKFSLPPLDIDLRTATVTPVLKEVERATS